jgi:hypothetical protein
MDELAFADIDADMAEGAAHGVEEHEVAGLELAAVDLLGGGCLLFGAAGEHVADRLVVHGADEAAAIETRFRRVAAAAVRHAEEADGGHHQVGSSFGDGLTDLLELSDQALVGEQACQLVIGSVLLRGCMDSDGK